MGPPKGNAWWWDSTYFRAWKRESNRKITLFREWSIWHPAWFGKLAVNMNFRQFLGVICEKNLLESGISRAPWGLRDLRHSMMPYQFLMIYMPFRQYTNTVNILCASFRGSGQNVSSILKLPTNFPPAYLDFFSRYPMISRERGMIVVE